MKYGACLSFWVKTRRKEYTEFHICLHFLCYAFEASNKNILWMSDRNNLIMLKAASTSLEASMKSRCCIYVLCCILYKYYLSSFPAYMEPMLAVEIWSSFHGNVVALGERLMLCCGWYFYTRERCRPTFLDRKCISRHKNI